MGKLLLIHGYGIGRSAPILFKHLNQDGGFFIFAELIKKKQASVFYWEIEKNSPYYD